MLATPGARDDPSKIHIVGIAFETDSRRWHWSSSGPQCQTDSSPNVIAWWPLWHSNAWPYSAAHGVEHMPSIRSYNLGAYTIGIGQCAEGRNGISRRAPRHGGVQLSPWVTNQSEPSLYMKRGPSPVCGIPCSFKLPDVVWLPQASRSLRQQ